MYITKICTLFIFLLIMAFLATNLSAGINKQEAEIFTNSILSNNKEMISNLLKNGVSVNSVIEYSMPALIYAINFSDIDMVEFLISKGADVNVRDSHGHTALMNAVKREKVDIVKLLIKKKADVNMIVPNAGNITALEWAAIIANKNIFDILIKNGANINMKNHLGYTTVIRTVVGIRENEREYGPEDLQIFEKLSLKEIIDWKKEVIKKSIGDGFYINEKDASGRTILTLAESVGNMEIVNLLISYGAKR